MKERRSANGASEPSSQKRIRVTYIVPETVDKNIEAYSQRQGLMKNHVVTVALQEFLKGQSLHPDRMPKLTITY
jgi:hypothetical protein